MDLQQRKLTKAEWDSIEVPLSNEEKHINHLICNGFHNVTLKQNSTISLLGYLKVQNSDEKVRRKLMRRDTNSEAEGNPTLWSSFSDLFGKTFSTAHPGDGSTTSTGSSQHHTAAGEMHFPIKSLQKANSASAAPVAPAGP